MNSSYKIILKQGEDLAKDCSNFISIFANMSALLFHELDDVNWVGFYLAENNNLVLGPFQGNIACTFIPYGKGVCGTCLKNKETIVVKNVHEFPGHIACDSRSNSEIVIPIYKNKEIFAVLDIDSEKMNRFSKIDQEGLEQIARMIGDNL